MTFSPERKLEIAREAAALLSEARKILSWARKYRSGEYDNFPEMKLAVRALSLAEERREQEEQERKAAISAAGLDPTDPCDCKIGDCKQSRMYCLEDRKQGYDKPASLSREAVASREEGDFVLVPREPSEAMILAKCEAELRYHETGSGFSREFVLNKFRAGYRAMLAAAPAPSSEVQALRNILARLWCRAEGNNPDDTISDAGHTVLEGLIGGLDPKALAQIDEAAAKIAGLPQPAKAEGDAWRPVEIKPAQPFVFDEDEAPPSVSKEGR